MTRRYRVLHAEMGHSGFTCQVKKSWWSPWKTLGYRSVYTSARRHTGGLGTYTYEENSHFFLCCTEENAVRRMDYEVKMYQESLELQRKQRAFKPTVVKEWP